MRKIFLFILISATSILSQHKFAWITDTHIGFDSADVELERIVGEINSLNDISFVLATGDITEKSKNSEFDRAKDILDQLEKPLLIIPGNHDTKWSNSGGAKFSEIWENENFIYQKDSTIYIGMNSAIPLRGGGGHFRPEDIAWLKEELSRIDTSKEIIFASHHPVDSDIDNWFKITNILRNYKIKVLLYGHGHKTSLKYLNGIPAVMARATISKGKKSYGFLLVENKKDTIKFYEVEKDTIPKFWNKISKLDSLTIPKIDSTDFINTSAKILFKKDIKTTLVAPPLFWKERIYVADYTGLVHCYNLKGKLLWDYDTFGDITGQPSVVENKLIVSTVQGELTILDAKNGDQLETIGFDEYLVAPPVIFKHKGSKNLIIPKRTNSNNAVLISTTSGKVFCYDLETLQEIWKNEDAKDMIEVAPMVIDDQIIFGSWDTYLYSIEANSGNTIWKWQGNNSFYYSPAACKPVTDGKYLYIATPDKYVYSIDLRLGTTRWKKKNYNAWESIGISKNKKRLFVKSVKDKLQIISARNGKLIKKVNVNFGTDTMPITPIEWNNKIIFPAKNGTIYRINKKYRYKSILHLGTSRLHSLQRIDDKRLMASNMDGMIVIFNIVGN